MNNTTKLDGGFFPIEEKLTKHYAKSEFSLFGLAMGRSALELLLASKTKLTAKERATVSATVNIIYRLVDK